MSGLHVATSKPQRRKSDQRSNLLNIQYNSLGHLTIPPPISSLPKSIGLLYRNLDVNYSNIPSEDGSRLECALLLVKVLLRHYFPAEQGYSIQVKDLPMPLVHAKYSQNWKTHCEHVLLVKEELVLLVLVINFDRHFVKLPARDEPMALQLNEDMLDYYTEDLVIGDMAVHRCPFIILTGSGMPTKPSWEFYHFDGDHIFPGALTPWFGDLTNSDGDWQNIFSFGIEDVEYEHVEGMFFAIRNIDIIGGNVPVEPEEQNLMGQENYVPLDEHKRRWPKQFAAADAWKAANKQIDHPRRPPHQFRMPPTSNPIPPSRGTRRSERLKAKAPNTASESAASAVDPPEYDVEMDIDSFEDMMSNTPSQEEADMEEAEMEVDSGDDYTISNAPSEDEVEMDIDPSDDDDKISNSYHSSDNSNNLIDFNVPESELEEEEDFADPQEESSSGTHKRRLLDNLIQPNKKPKTKGAADETEGDLESDEEDNESDEEDNESDEEDNESDEEDNESDEDNKRYDKYKRYPEAYRTMDYDSYIKFRIRADREARNKMDPKTYESKGRAYLAKQPKRNAQVKDSKRYFK